MLAAFVWRRLLFNTTFIVIAGSVGKTTTKEFLANILETQFPVTRTLGNNNHRRFKGPEMTILGTRPWHKFAVIEVGTEVPGDMESAAKFLKPDIIAMLDIKRCHTNVFKTLEALAEEKSQLLNYLSDKGCAILNQDNPFVASMTVKNTRARTIRFGASESSDLRLVSSESKWPQRLKLRIIVDGVSHDIETRLVGTHWAPTIMASLAAAMHCGISITEAITAIRSIAPFWARMQPITLPSSGATILRDDWNGSIDTFDAAFKVLHEASASRKIVIFSDFSDSTKKLRSRANYLGRMAEKYADVAVFVGDYADRSVQAARTAGMGDESAHAFLSLSAAVDFLNQELRSGDLALIKGQANHHLSRIYIGLLGPVGCTISSCPKQILCDRCPELDFERSPEFKDLMAAPGSHV